MGPQVGHSHDDMLSSESDFRRSLASLKQQTHVLTILLFILVACAFMVFFLRLGKLIQFLVDEVILKEKQENRKTAHSKGKRSYKKDRNTKSKKKKKSPKSSKGSKLMASSSVTSLSATKKDDKESFARVSQRTPVASSQSSAARATLAAKSPHVALPMEGVHATNASKAVKIASKNLHIGKGVGANSLANISLSTFATPMALSDKDIFSSEFSSTTPSPMSMTSSSLLSPELRQQREAQVLAYKLRQLQEMRLKNIPRRRLAWDEVELRRRGLLSRNCDRVPTMLVNTNPSLVDVSIYEDGGVCRMLTVDGRITSPMLFSSATQSVTDARTANTLSPTTISLTSTGGGGGSESSSSTKRSSTRTARSYGRTVCVEPSDVSTAHCLTESAMSPFLSTPAPSSASVSTANSPNSNRLE